jgi:hypothetical protein
MVRRHDFVSLPRLIGCCMLLLVSWSCHRCDNIIESDLLKHLQSCGRRYTKIDLRGCNKLTGTVLFRECEKRSLSEGLIKSDSVFDCEKFQ